MNKEKVKVLEHVCECGIIVKGLNPTILLQNIVSHKSGNPHKNAMENKKRILEGVKNG